MDRGSLSPDDIAYRRALSSAQQKHAEGGGEGMIHQKESNIGEGSANEINKKGGEKIKEMEGEKENMNISDKPSDKGVNDEANEIRTEEGNGGRIVADPPLGTGGGGGASSGLMEMSARDLTGRIRELEALERHPLPKLADAEHHPKAIAATFNPPPHIPPSNASGYHPNSVNEHMRTGGGKAIRSQKMIMQPGGKYGQRY